MAKHGEFFPENPKNIDELLDSLAKRAAAAQRFRNSLSADQRAELDALAQQAFGSPSLMNALDRLDSHLQAARPGEDWSGSERFSGDDPLGHGRGRSGAGRHRRARATGRAAVAELLRRHDGRRRPGHAGPPTRRRRRGRRQDAGRTRTHADEPGLPGPRLRRPVAAVAQGHAAARPGRAARRGAASCRAATANATPAGPGRRASSPGRRGRGSSATPSRGTSPGR